MRECRCLGNVFSASQTATSFMRFNVAQCDDPIVMTVLQRAIGKSRGAALPGDGGGRCDI